MLRDIDKYFIKGTETNNACLQYLRNFILAYDHHITEDWKYRMPFYFYKGRRFCYLWTNQKTQQPYIGFTDGKLMEHPKLMAGDRARMKIMLIDPLQDIPVNELKEIINMALALC